MTGRPLSSFFETGLFTVQKHLLSGRLTHPEMGGISLISSLY